MLLLPTLHFKAQMFLSKAAVGHVELSPPLGVLVVAIPRGYGPIQGATPGDIFCRLLCKRWQPRREDNGERTAVVACALYSRCRPTIFAF